MKTGIMGTHGIGKSNLSLYLAHKYKQDHPERQVALISGTTRHCPFPVNLNTTLKAQQWIFCTQMRREITAREKSDILVCDRTVLDSVAYSHRMGFRQWVLLALPMALDHLGTYDRLIWLRPSSVRHGISDDGFRDTDKEFQTQIDDIFRQWTDQYHIRSAEIMADTSYQEIYYGIGLS